MPQKKESEFLPYLAATIGTITSIGYGSAMTWTSPAIPYLMSEKSYLPVTKEQSDKISSLLTVGYIIGYILNPFIIERLGSRRTLLIYTLPQISSWCLIFMAENHITIYIARILAGIGYGAGICALTIYLSDIGTPKTRGIFISLMNLAMGLGFFFMMLLGAYLPYNSMNLCFFTLPIIFAITFFFMPDSSHFMEKFNRNDQEMKERLNPSQDAEKEKSKHEEINFNSKMNSNFNEDSNLKVDSDFKENSELTENSKLKEDYYQKENLNSKDSKEKEDSELKENQDYSNSFNIKESSLWKLISRPNSRKALIVVISLAAQDVFSGHMVLWSFTQQLLTYRGSSIDPEKATFFLAISKIVAAVICAQIIEKMGRRILLLSTGIIGTISHGLVGAFFFLEERNYDVSFFGWWPVAGMTIYEVTFAIGAANMFYLYQAELFSSDVKSMAVMICKVSYMTFTYFCLFRFQVLFVVLGKSTIFFFFTVCAGFSTIFVFYITPETRGKTIDEIQVILSKKKFFV